MVLHPPDYALITVFTGLMVVVVGIFQFEITRAKLRLDLYDRRFRIYLAAADLYQATVGSDLSKLEAMSLVFVKAFRESVFLFDSKHGIYKTLEQMKDGVAAIIAFEKMKLDDHTGRDELFRLMHEQSTSNVLMFEERLLKLERQMAPYLNFHRINGWGNP